jgi:hypothetical protein
MTSRLHDVFSMIETHQMSISQGSKVLDDNFMSFAEVGTNSLGLINKELRTLIDLNDEFGTKSKSIADYMRGQLTNAAKGFSLALTISGNALDSYDELSKKQKDLQKQMSTETSVTGLESLQKEFDDVTEKLKTVGPLFQATKVHSQAAATAIADSIIGIVEANVDAGMSFIGAVEQAAPSVEALQKQMIAAGFEGSESFNLIAEEVKLAKDVIAGPAIAAVEGFTAGMVGLSNAGQLTEDKFAGLAGQIADTEAALVAQGYSSDVVMLAMQNDLQTIWELQQDYGYKVDDTTQALIDQGVQSGLIGEQGKTDNEKILDVLVEIAKALGATIPDNLDKMAKSAHDAAAKAQEDLSKIKAPDIGDISFNIYGHYVADENAPAYAAVGGRVMSNGISYIAGGDTPFMPRGSDTVPAMLTPGEIVLNAAQQRNLAGAVGDNSGIEAGLAQISSALSRDRQEMPRLLLRAVRDAVELANA